MTEQEIYEGILNDEKRKDPWNSSLVFIRKIKDIEQNIEKNIKLRSRFIDLNEDGKIKTLVKDRLNKLKTTELKRVYKKEVEKRVIKLDPVIIIFFLGKIE